MLKNIFITWNWFNSWSCWLCGLLCVVLRQIFGCSRISYVNMLSKVLQQIKFHWFLRTVGFLLYSPKNNQFIFARNGVTGPKHELCDKYELFPEGSLISFDSLITENLVEDLLGDFEYEVQVPYLLYRNAAQEVNGIWFYNSPDCEAVANLFSRYYYDFSRCWWSV